MIKSFPPISIGNSWEAEDSRYEFFMLVDFLKGYTDYEESIYTFIGMCQRLVGIIDKIPMLSRVDNTTFQCSWEHYLTTDVHWIISFSMDFAKVDSYSVYFCRNNSCFTTEFNDRESAEKLVIYLFDKVRDNAELWV